MKRILILTAIADHGRDVAARQLAALFDRLPAGSACVEVADPAMHGPGWGERLRRPFAAGALTIRTALLDLLRGFRPDVVVVLHPAHAALLGELDRGGRPRDFVVTALVTEPGETGWAQMPVDAFIVPSTRVAATLSPIEPFRIKTLGYPVLGPKAGSRPALARGLRVLWIDNGSTSKGPKLLARLLEQKKWSLTLVTNDAELSTLAREAAAKDQLELVTDYNRVPALLARNHLLVARPETPLWHEAVVAGCPLVAFRAAGESEVGNVALLQTLNAGGAATRSREVIEWIERAVSDDGRVLELWRRNAAQLGSPQGGEAIVRFLLDQAAIPLVPLLKKTAALGTVSPKFPNAAISLGVSDPSTSLCSAQDDGASAGDVKTNKRGAEKKLLLCDLHTHTTWSDGKLTIPELVDFYGQRGFDCVCVTDHLCDPDRLLGKLVNMTGLVIAPGKVANYFAAIEREKKRAWSQYKMLLMAGIEFNKDGYTPKTSAHLLGVDLKKPIDPTLDLPALIGEIHAQDGLAIASHPHEIKSEWGKNTLYLWEHVEQFAPLLDAWEIANRDDLFNPVGLRKLPFIASSDFHKPKHIHSWKTLLWCEKDPEAIKQCIRLNRDVSLTLYRNHRFGLEEREEMARPELAQR